MQGECEEGGDDHNVSAWVGQILIQAVEEHASTTNVNENQPYPLFFEETMNIINTLSKMSCNQFNVKGRHKTPETSTKMVFNQSSKKEKQKKDISKITFFHCGQKGHYPSDCPKWEKHMHTTIANDDNKKCKSVTYFSPVWG